MPLKQQMAQGIYPGYDALWHLDALGLNVSNALADAQADPPKPWAQAVQTKGCCVALIDTTVSPDHPCLAGVIDTKRAVDFTNTPTRKAGADTAMDVVSAVETQIAEYIDKATQPVPNSSFGAHGTAMAGIIGARPAIATQFQAGMVTDPNTISAPQAVLMPLPYVGVDPFCTIIPIAIGAQPDPEQVLAAFKYAQGCDVDLIVIASDLPNPLQEQGPQIKDPAHLDNLRDDQIAVHNESHGRAPVEVSQIHRKLWCYLAWWLPEMSKTIPVICAAGNTPHRIVFPASLADDSNGIFAVGAVRRDKRLCAYSPSQDVTVFAYSGDDERFDRALLRHDVYRDGFGRDDEAIWLKDDIDAYSDDAKTAVETIISTDVPGRHGYNGSAHNATRINGTVALADVEPDGPGAARLIEALGRAEAIEIYSDFGSNFCRFSGSSAAAAVFGGLVSLGLSSGVLKPGFAAGLKDALQGDDAYPVADWAIIQKAGEEQE